MQHAQPALPLPRGEKLEPALHRRVLSVNSPRESPTHHVILLTSGRLQFSSLDEEVQPVLAPAVAMLPHAREGQVTLEAGSRAYLLGARDDQVTAALGDYPEAQAIRSVLSAAALVRDLEPAELTRLERAFEQMVEEIRLQPPGAIMAIAAYLRLILVTAWRLSGGLEETIASSGDGLSVLQTFRQLVEAQFRRHRPMTYYAEQLGITADRLHAISTRHLGRPPLDLVHDRLAREACHYLERSSLSVQAVSDSLNFKDPAHFSRFFKRRIGTAPAQYRSMIRRASQTHAPDTRLEYHEWP